MQIWEICERPRLHFGVLTCILLSVGCVAIIVRFDWDWVGAVRVRRAEELAKARMRISAA